MKAGRILAVALCAVLGAGCDLGEVPIVSGMFAEIDGNIETLYEGPAEFTMEDGVLTIASDRAAEAGFSQSLRLVWGGDGALPAVGDYRIAAPGGTAGFFHASYTEIVGGDGASTYTAGDGVVRLNVVEDDRVAGSARFVASSGAEREIDVALEFTATRAP